jgi:hypothetical protein
MNQMTLFQRPAMNHEGGSGSAFIALLSGIWRERAIQTVRTNHYTHSVPSGKTHWFEYRSALVAWSIPANNNVSKFLIGEPNRVWELSRLWAPDGHEPNLLTIAIAATLRELRAMEPDLLAVVSYADPNAGHHGGVYRAASWMYLGQCEESRYYVDENGQSVARRKFHSGDRCMVKAEIEARGFREMRKPGKHRFALGLTKKTRKRLRQRLA